ncbi:HAMP domain-containing sensor histidine kinase [Nannocystis sp. SCPEA4]|uniref:sensor histidine kinase n=1 Tax=Nannocystis sp. SCPEA4 TaxID=2996787 RepID=UPI00226F4A4D
MTLLLAIGMALSVHRLATAADEQIARLRAEENEITLVGRLRWRTELIVSDGRGYFLSGDPDLLAQVERSTRQFDVTIHELLATQAIGPLVADVERAVRDFLQVQAELVAARQHAWDVPLLARRFETELLPLRRRLDQALERLVEHKAAVLEDAYRAASARRNALALQLYGLLGALVLLGLGIAWYFTGLLHRSYRQEQEALAASRKALAARDEIMGIVAHDLRNPLSAITMKAALLRRRSESEKTRQQAESIENMTVRMERLIRGMLDVATIEAGKFSVTLAPCPVREILHETAAMFGPLASDRNVRFEQRADRPELAVLADRERVIQVLSNIVGNALKFTPADGQVTLTAEPRGAEVCFTVSDTGPGIPQEHLTHIFDRFWKNEMPGKKGTGLGLFIARGIVVAHGGRIWAESEPGRGAKFCFTLPAADTRGE